MDDESGGSGLSSAQVQARQRLEFIEFRLFWTGRINRRDLMEKFRISAPQASNDLASYQRLAPANLVYDTNLKGYVRGKAFQPTPIAQSADRYLTQMIGIAKGWVRKEDTFFGNLPPVDVLALDHQPTNPDVLLKMLDAIRVGAEIQMEYCSMTGSPATERSIAPHALGAAWGRWYARAWSREHNDFRDYALARVQKIGKAVPSTIDPAQDIEWHQKIDLVLVPNPELDEDRQRAQRIEHNMTDGALRLPCRLSMAFYLMAEHKLDVPPGKLLPVQQPLVLANLEEVKQARQTARTMSQQALQRAAGS